MSTIIQNENRIVNRIIKSLKILQIPDNSHKEYEIFLFYLALIFESFL